MPADFEDSSQRRESVATSHHPRSTTPMEDKPLVVQQWLRGEISTEAAILLALSGDDPGVKVWAYHLFSTQVVDPKSIVTVTNVST